MFRFLFLGLSLALLSMGCQKDDNGGNTRATTPDRYSCNSGDVYMDYRGGSQGFVYRDRRTRDILDCNNFGFHNDQCYRYYPRKERWKNRHGEWVDDSRCGPMNQFGRYPYSFPYVGYCQENFGYGSFPVQRYGYWYCFIPHNTWGLYGGGTLGIYSGRYQHRSRCRIKRNHHLGGLIQTWYTSCDDEEY